jgi:uncharacterized membrane protein YhaH (DUF805 family)
MNWYVEALKKYADFDGRSRRKEYWYFMLFNSLVVILFTVVDFVTGTLLLDAGAGMLSGLYGLAVMIPSTAVLIRRLHDTDRSGWWLFIAFVPLIGAITLFVFTIQDSDAGPNQYGVNPKRSGFA